MLLGWIRKIRNRSESLPTPRQKGQDENHFPHADWQDWLASAKWERAALQLFESQKNPNNSADESNLIRWKSEMVCRFLECGWEDLSPDSALGWIRWVDRLADFQMTDDQLEEFRMIADEIWDTQRAEQRGNFREAEQKIDQAIHKITHSRPALADRLRNRKKFYETLKETVERLINELQYSTDKKAWERSLEIAQSLLKIAPEHPGALATLRQKPNTFQSRDSSVHVIETLPHAVIDHERPAFQTETCHKKPESIASVQPIPDRFLIQIDGTASWMAFTSDHVNLDGVTIQQLFDTGEIFPEETKIPFHCDEEGCWILKYASSNVLVNGKPAMSRVLSHGENLKIGKEIEFLFHQPRMETGSASLILKQPTSKVGIQGLLLVGTLFSLGRDQNHELIHSGFQTPIQLIKKPDKITLQSTEPFTVEGDEPTIEYSIDFPCRIKAHQSSLFFERFG